jgi:biotin carboxyl carrier protein
VAALSEQIQAEERALKIQKEELAANERLLEQGYVQKTRLMTLQRAVAEYEARHGERRAELSKSRQRASELEFRILSMRNAYAQTAADELKETTARIFDLEERIRPARDAAERQKIVAPIAGEVVGPLVQAGDGTVGDPEPRS